MSTEDDADEKRRGSPAMQKTREMRSVTGSMALPEMEMQSVSGKGEH
jgi:hypothetical protein